ncbi:MAG TPA: hypothetical protein VK735_08400 [Pseudonocardia sp.]|uniref:hypothetical protein n=1 Tax=Pseudonocardia sp. TaxID=60912 RepID=UPI002C7877A9|nr:hypothetical protein [Pseudonocardia sp.]HTF47451.1 hypothetical protein [Pseudonocardia sp.]
MSLTPIYDELREHRVPGGTASAQGARRSTALRLVPLQSGRDNLGQLAGRGGLGGRHRRPSH